MTASPGWTSGNEEAVRAVFQQLLEDFEAGRISAEELDELSKEGLFDLFRRGADYLDSFNEGIRNATLEMSNIRAAPPYPWLLKSPRG